MTFFNQLGSYIGTYLAGPICLFTLSFSQSIAFHIWIEKELAHLPRPCRKFTRTQLATIIRLMTGVISVMDLQEETTSGGKCTVIF